MRILNGDGLKVSDVTDPYPAITADNLDQYAKTEWKLTTPGVGEGPPDQFLSKSYIDGLFNNASK